MTTELEQTDADHGDDAVAWRASFDELACWAWRHLVNRRDVFGGQYVDDSGAIRRTTRRDGLTREVLYRHFAAARTEDVIGLHATAPDETCRWLAVDIDAHDGQGACPEANFRHARAILERASRAGLAARLIDSGGGNGGFHLWATFGGPIPMADARRLVLWLVRDWAEHGLARRPDLFPGNDRLTGKRCGNWLRLPGRHHKRDCWARAWSTGREAWLAGGEAVDALLSLRGGPVEVASIVPADFSVARSAAAPNPAKIGGPASPSDASGSRRRAPSPPKRPRRARTSEVRLARTALEFYENDDLDYDDWLAIGMALRNLEDEEAALRLWDDWSETSGKYNPVATDVAWRSLRPADESGGIGLGTLFLRAMEAGWAGPSILEEVDRRGMRRSTHRSGRRGTILVPVPVRLAKGGVGGPVEGDDGRDNQGDPGRAG